MAPRNPYQVPLPISGEMKEHQHLATSVSTELGRVDSGCYGNAVQIDRLGEAFCEYLAATHTCPLVAEADATVALRKLPGNSIDFVMTSPPYWSKREYDNGGIGLEEHWKEYIEALMPVFREVKRVLKPSGSFWLNVGDSYFNKGLVGLPWRIALHLMDNQGWILRNSVIWNKVKSGMDSSGDRLGNAHESVFHFVKRSKGYYYNVDSIRSRPRQSRVDGGRVVTATGVSGVKYRRQIQLSTALDELEKENALNSLVEILDDVRSGRLADFRMIIRGQQRVTHSDSSRVSGRAKELDEKGFYFLKYHPKGSKPTDVWDVIPEDSQNRSSHFSPYPDDLCRIPILATCPQNGIALDPFCGTGTTLRVASSLGRKSIGIDISLSHLRLDRYGCCFA